MADDRDADRMAGALSAIQWFAGPEMTESPLMVLIFSLARNSGIDGDDERWDDFAQAAIDRAGSDLESRGQLEAARIALGKPVRL